MKRNRFISLAAVALLTAAMALCLCACGSTSSADSGKQSALENEEITIDAVYVNDEYTNEEHPSLRQVWVFTTLHPTSGTLKASSYGGTLSVGEEKYNATFDSSKYGIWFPSYHYSNTIKEVLKSESFKLAISFEVSDSDLGEDAEITFEDLGKTDCKDIIVYGKDIKHGANTEEIAKIVDPDGYSKAVKSREPADSETSEEVANALNDMQYYASYGSISWKCNFGIYEYSLTSMGLATTGTYEVLNGYLLFINDDNNSKAYIPWQWKDNGTIKLDLPSGLLGENG